MKQIEKKMKELIRILKEEVMLVSGGSDKRILKLVDKMLQDTREEVIEKMEKRFDEFWDLDDEREESSVKIYKKGYGHGFIDAKKGRKKTPHDTRKGYCCACDYDIAGFEDKLDKLTKKK